MEHGHALTSESFLAAFQGLLMQTETSVSYHSVFEIFIDRTGEQKSLHLYLTFHEVEHGLSFLDLNSNLFPFRVHSLSSWVGFCDSSPA